MGVDEDPLSLSLLEQLSEVPQVVTGNEDRLSLLHPERYAHRDGVAVGAGVCRVKEFHRPEVGLAALHQKPERRIKGQIRIGEGGSPLMEEGEDRLVLLAQNQGVVGVGGHPLESVQERVFQREDVGVGGRI